MNIINLRVMRGPNYWSNYRHKVIVLKLDLEELEEQPTNLIEGFAERLKALVPSLYEHRCSEGHPGGFFERVEKGTWMGHVVEHLALELQSLAGIEVGYGRTSSNGKKGVYYVIYSYEVESAGICAGEAAVEICDALAKNEPVDINAVIARIKHLCIGIGLGEDTALIIRRGNEAECRGSGMVTIIDGKDIGHTNIAYAKDDTPVSVENLRVHILARGDGFLLKERRFLPCKEDIDLEESHQHE